jgi:hypothetical protein
MFLVTGLRLLLPAVIPSWRFFDAVSASPRVEYLLSTPSGEPIGEWREARPRPPSLSWPAMLRRMFWNPAWNESLYLVSLSERLLIATDPATVRHSQGELFLRVAGDLHRCGLADAAMHLQLRICLQARGDGEDVESEVAYLSQPRALADLIAR